MNRIDSIQGMDRLYHLALVCTPGRLFINADCVKPTIDSLSCNFNVVSWSDFIFKDLLYGFICWVAGNINSSWISRVRRM